MTFEEWLNNQSPSVWAALRSEVTAFQCKILWDAAQQDATNAPWLTLAHTICTDQGIPPGHIMARLEMLRDKLDDDLK